MGRELQKRKRRSGAQPVRRKPASKKQILSNPIIAANWNSKVTLAKNYRNLGLVSKLNKRAGGVEKRTEEDVELTEKAEHPFAILPGTTHTQKAIVEVQLELDPETGKLRAPDIGLSGDANPLNDPLNRLDSDDEFDGPAQAGSLGFVQEKGTGTGITRELEKIASMGVRKRPRQQSEREEEWVERLVQKHGSDFAAMFKDRKLNPMQQSQGDIKRRITKWQSKQQLPVVV